MRLLLLLAFATPLGCVIVDVLKFTPLTCGGWVLKKQVNQKVHVAQHSSNEQNPIGRDEDCAVDLSAGGDRGTAANSVLGDTGRHFRAE